MVQTISVLSVSVPSVIKMIIKVDVLSLELLLLTVHMQPYETTFTFQNMMFYTWRNTNIDILVILHSPKPINPQSTVLQPGDVHADSLEVITVFTGSRIMRL